MANAYRDMKRRARTQLHERMSEPVWFFEDEQATPVRVTVRLHFTFDQLGELLRGGFAERTQIVPKIIFLNPPPIKRHSLVVTEDMGIFDVDYIFPPDDITVTAEVVKLAATQVAQLAVELDPSLPWGGLPAPEPEA